MNYKLRKAYDGSPLILKAIIYLSLGILVGSVVFIIIISMHGIFSDGMNDEADTVTQTSKSEYGGDKLTFGDVPSISPSFVDRSMVSSSNQLDFYVGSIDETIIEVDSLGNTQTSIGNPNHSKMSQSPIETQVFTKAAKLAQTSSTVVNQHIFIPSKSPSVGEHKEKRKRLDA